MILGKLESIHESGYQIVRVTQSDHPIYIE